MPTTIKADRTKPVLIVDDFATMRRIVRNSLEHLGFTNIIEAEDGYKALEKLKKTEVQLIVSDWNMPNMQGIDLLRAVRGDNRTKTVPFLMLTAEAQKDNIIEAAKAGVSNYIVKPFTLEAMQKKLEAIFDSK